MKLIEMVVNHKMNHIKLMNYLNYADQFQFPFTKEKLHKFPAI